MHRARARVPLLSVLAVLAVLAGAVLAGAGPAGAKTVPGSPPFRVILVEHLTGSEFRGLARRGAVGLLVPGVGPTTNRRQMLAELVRGAEENAHLGGVPKGPVLLNTQLVTGRYSGTRAIVVEMPFPPKGPPVANDRRLRIAVLGGGYHGLLQSPTTRIAGLVSIVDIAPTALGHERGSLSWAPSGNSVASLESLNLQIHANNRLKLAALIVVACFIALLAFIRPRAALTAVPAALFTSVALGAAQVTNEVAILALLIAGTVGGGLWLARVCRTDDRLLALLVGTVLVHLWLLAAKPEWVALTPLGPTQNSRFWGIGNQLETLLIAPLLAGALLAGRRFGAVGYAGFALLSLVLVTDNRFGSDGGGAIVLGVAFAFLWARTRRLGVRGFVTLLLLAATAVLTVVTINLRTPGPNHFRSAFGHGLSGLLAVAENRVPLAYTPAIHNWTMVLPLLVWLVVVYAVALRTARTRVTRDLLLAVGVAVCTSLLVNDSVTYELTGGVACAVALARFAPETVALRVPLLGRLPLPAAQPLPNEARQD